MRRKIARMTAGIALAVLPVVAAGNGPSHAQAPAATVTGSVEGMSIGADCSGGSAVNQVETTTTVQFDFDNDGDVDQQFLLREHSAGSDFNTATFTPEETSNGQVAVTATGRTGKVSINFGPCGPGAAPSGGRTVTQPRSAVRSGSPAVPLSTRATPVRERPRFAG